MDISELKKDDLPFAIMIGKRVIPAWNIQVENFPGGIFYEDEPDLIMHFYPILFEIPFETGELWVVTYYGENPDVCHEQCFEPDDLNGQIKVEIYPNFKKEPFFLDIVLYYSDWAEFLRNYEIAAKTPDFHVGRWYVTMEEFKPA